MKSKYLCVKVDLYAKFWSYGTLYSKCLLYFLHVKTPYCIVKYR